MSLRQYFKKLGTDKSINRPEKQPLGDNRIFYYHGTTSHEEDVEVAINEILSVSDAGFEEARNYLLDHAQLTDEMYERLTTGLVEKIEKEVHAVGLDSDVTLLLQELLFDKGNGLVTSAVFDQLKNRLANSESSICKMLYHKNFN